MTIFVVCFNPSREFNERNKPTHTARRKVQLHIWSASLISCCFSSISSSCSFRCLGFLGAVYYAWKLCSQESKKKSWILNIYLIKISFQAFSSKQISLFFLLPQTSATYAHFNNLLHKIIQRCVQYVEADSWRSFSVLLKDSFVRLGVWIRIRLWELLKVCKL